VSRAGQVVDSAGEISDAATRDAIARFVKGFVSYIGECSRP
jgi:hypothetical protein